MGIRIRKFYYAAGVLALILGGILFFSCEQPGGLEDPQETEVTPDPQAMDYTVTADGENNAEDSKVLSFSFAEAVPDLSLSHIRLTNDTGTVSPGNLTGQDRTWSLEIAVVKAGDISIRIEKDGIVAGERRVAVYQKGEQVILTWSTQVNGKADTETSTAITLSFSGTVSGLTGERIRLDPGTGRASLVDVSGMGQTWLLLIAVEQGGSLSIGIDQEGIDPGPRSITVHKGAEIPPVEKVGITVLSPPDTTYYSRNQSFDTRGLTVAWVYSDGSTEDIPTGGYILDEPDMTKYTPKVVKVRAGGFETGFTIQVVNTDRVLQSITVDGPDKKTQDLGKEFDKTGLVVTGYFSDGTMANLTSLAALVGYDKFKRGPQEVRVKVNNKTAALEGITTRIGVEATVSIYTGYGVKTTFIKGEVMTPEKANIMFEFRPSGDFLMDNRKLSLANGGLNPADFEAFSGYDPNRRGKQTFSLTLDGRPFEVGLYVVDAKPEVWFDYGYMRHDGDPEGAGKGAGIDAGKYYAKPNETLVIAPVRYLIGYNQDHSDAEVSYSWTVSGSDATRTYTTSKGGELLHITPKTAGTYTISVTVTGRDYTSGGSITKTAGTELVCYTGSVSNGGKIFTSPLKHFGPGQMCEGGTGLGWSLGSAGGYEVWKVESQDSYRIYGNPLSGWREPGVVWMQEDRNGNGLPDEMWYELPGGEENHSKWKDYITRRYALTYFKTDDYGSINEYGQKIREVYWVDSRGRAGMIPGGFPGNPTWMSSTGWGVVGDWVTYTCTLFRDDGVIFAEDYNMTELEGYVDCTADVTFPVGRAVRADGTPANLSAVKFLKVQTGMFRYGGIFGDVSTEIVEADFLEYQAGGFPMP
jgi:hypothetical protein